MMIGRCLIRASDVESLTSIQISKWCIIVDFEVHIFSHQRIQAGEDLFTSYYSLPFLAGLLPTLCYLFCNCALLCRTDKGTMKQGHRLSWTFWCDFGSCYVVCVRVCVSRGGVGWGWKPSTADEQRPSRQQLRGTDSMESLQLFLHGCSAELLIECECKLQRLLIWHWLERHTHRGGLDRGVRQPASSPPYHLDSPHLLPLVCSPPHHTPLITSHWKAGKTTTFYSTQQQQDIVTP